MSNDMIVRKKMLKIQERLGMNLGIIYGTKAVPVVRTKEQVLKVLRDIYKMGLKAFLLPPELFADISTTTDLYKTKYGELLKIREEAKKANIELSLHNPSLPEQPDDTLKIFCNISSIMDCRNFVIQPNFYKRMPQEQAKSLIVHTLNEIVTGLRTPTKIGIETTGKAGELGSLEDVIDIAKRTQSTEPVINWAHIHARGAGTLRTERDFRLVLDKLVRNLGQAWLGNAYFLFSGISYGPSGEIKHIPLSQSDLNLEFLIRQITSLGIRGTMIFEDPDRERLILNIVEQLGDMVR